VACPQCQKRWKFTTMKSGGGVIWTVAVQDVFWCHACPSCGARAWSQTVAVPWAEKYGGLAALRALAIECDLECFDQWSRRDLQAISWDEVTGSSNGRQTGIWREDPKVMARLCVDEKGMGHGTTYDQWCPSRSGADQVQLVGEGREQEKLGPFGRA